MNLGPTFNKYSFIIRYNGIPPLVNQRLSIVADILVRMGVNHSQLLKEQFTYSPNQSINQSSSSYHYINQSINCYRSITQSISKSANQSINQPIDYSINYSTNNQFSYRFTCQSINQLTYRFIGRSINQIRESFPY